MCNDVVNQLQLTDPESRGFYFAVFMNVQI